MPILLKLARLAAMTLIASAVASPAPGQSNATCAAYMKADAAFYAISDVRDVSLLAYLQHEIADPERRAALKTITKFVRQSPLFSIYVEHLHRAYREAYEGPVVKERRAMSDLVMADVERCKQRIGYERWPKPRKFETE